MEMTKATILGRYKRAKVKKKDTAKAVPKAAEVPEEKAEAVTETNAERVEMKRHRAITEILASEPMDDSEKERLARYKAIPAVVKEVCMNEMTKLHKEMMELEMKYDALVDFMNGDVA